MATKPPKREPRETAVSNEGEVTIQYSGRPPFLIDEVFQQRDPSREPTAVCKSVAQIKQEGLVKEACLVVIYGPDLGRKFTLTNQSLTVGRVDGCEVQPRSGEATLHRQGPRASPPLESSRAAAKQPSTIRDPLIPSSPYRLIVPVPISQPSITKPRPCPHL